VTPLAISVVLAGAALGLSLRFNWWRPASLGVPILMYHQIGPHLRGSALNKWRVLPEDFERQMAHLAAKGLRGISLRQLLDEPDEPHEPRRATRRAVITFDDGYAALVPNALPVLQRHGFGATVFVVAGSIGATNDWDEERPGEPLLDAPCLLRLQEAGVEIGSHSFTHRGLTRLSDEELEREVDSSRVRLEEVTGRPVVSFCYPYGDFDDRVVAAVRHAGFRAATVIRSGISRDLADPYRLRRIVVRGTDPFLDFSLALTRGRSKL
jgi:peptidoglycan/xylan/chitin deacetylase (PgdA/CDA1 family)